VFLLRDSRLLYGVLTLVVVAFFTNLVLGQFNAGFEGQPVAHTDHLMNFAGMALAGLAFTLAGGCPGRQLFLAGEGDADSGLFVAGMIVGAGLAHTYNMASSPAGAGPYGTLAIVAGLIICIIFGFTMREART
jgi:YedE family putative selenium metabolism protein